MYVFILNLGFRCFVALIITVSLFLLTLQQLWFFNILSALYIPTLSPPLPPFAPSWMKSHFGG